VLRERFQGLGVAAQAVQQVHQQLGAVRGAAGAVVGVDLAAEVLDGLFDLLPAQGRQVQPAVAVGVLEGRGAAVLPVFGEVGAVVGELHGLAEVRPVGQKQRHPHHRREVAAVDVVAVVLEQPGPAHDQGPQVLVGGRGPLAALDLHPQVGGQVGVQPPHQHRHAIAAHVRGLAGVLIHQRDGLAGAVAFQDPLEPPARMHLLLPGDVDQHVDLVVGGLGGVQRLDRDVGLADGPQVRPRPADVVGRQEQVGDLAAHVDDEVLVVLPLGGGDDLRQVGRVQGQAHLPALAKAQGVEHPRVLPGLGEHVGELVERRPRAAGGQRLGDHLERLGRQLGRPARHRRNRRLGRLQGHLHVVRRSFVVHGSALPRVPAGRRLPVEPAASPRVRTPDEPPTGPDGSFPSRSASRDWPAP
jgi:hypothetical protein